MIFLDTETCGFVGPIVLIQTKELGEEPNLLNIWKTPIDHTLRFIERLMEEKIGIFNATFDAFHLARCYNTLRQFSSPARCDPPVIDDYKKYAYQSWKGKCIKPAGVIDYFLLLKEREFKELFKTKKILIKNIPNSMVSWLANELHNLVQQLNPLMFGNTSSGFGSWSVVKGKEGFKNLFLDFEPTSKLKAIIGYLFNIDTIEYGIPNDLTPNEQCPFSNKSRSHYNPNSGDWEKYIRYHIKYWSTTGVPYAQQDVICLEMLHTWLNGGIKDSECRRQPYQIIDAEQLNHMNSELAWSVGVNRQRGFPIRFEESVRLLNDILLAEQENQVPTAPAAGLTYLHQVADGMEKPFITSTDEKSLVSFTQFLRSSTGVNPETGEKETTEIPSPVAIRAQEIIDARHREKQKLLLNRLIVSGRYYPNFNIVGTQTNRMSGTGGINPQGIDRELRWLFFPTSKEETISGGDFDSQELSLAASIYPDRQLYEDLVNKVDLHAWSAANLYPESDHFDNKSETWKIIPKKIEDVTKEERYDGKNKVNFPIIYGSEEEGISFHTGRPPHIVHFAYTQFFKRYTGAAKVREKLTKEFSALLQPHGIGTKVFWQDPKEYIESDTGWRRYFVVEQQVCRFLFDLANRVPENKEIVWRKDKEQTASGATRTALYACCFQIQSKIVRVSCNHIIQNPGAELTKRLQLAIWDLQPAGVCDWLVQLFNVHDEIICPNVIPTKVEARVEETLTKFREKYPLVKMTWKTGLKDWSEK